MLQKTIAICGNIQGYSYTRIIERLNTVIALISIIPRMSVMSVLFIHPLYHNIRANATCNNSPDML